jgi:multiple sugar transport system ATP-binding protein
VAEIILDQITKRFPDGSLAVDDFNLDIADGEFVILVGPSGCGKSTTLNMIAGLEDITSGELRIGGQVVNTKSPKDRDIAMVFQSYALYPHMTVRENMGFALKLAKTPQATINEKVEEAARILDLTQHLDRKPANLSGGQRQRVAMGRAIVRDPAAFLMDEPLSNLDAKLRVQMRAEIKKLQNDLGVTTVYVTHDQVEAMTMGDRVSVLRKGVLQQVAQPEELYHRPQNMFVAGFIGSPAMNMIEATVVRGNESTRIVAGQMSIDLSAATLSAHPALPAYEGRTIVLGIRPEGLNDAALAGDDRQPRVRGQAELREALGSEVLMHFSVQAHAAATDEVRELAQDAGDDRAIEQLGSLQRATLVGRFSPQTRIRHGDTIEVAIDESALHFFDPSTGGVIYDKAAVPAAA